MSHCANCGVDITDPTTQVVHGDMTFCCVNCSTAMEQHGSGSTGTGEDDKRLRCSHCDVPIVNDSSMTSRGDRIFCCTNCAGAHEAVPTA
jgi:hypothetical protein